MVKTINLWIVPEGWSIILSAFGGINNIQIDIYMKILAIDTSADETSASVTEGRRVLSSVLYSQIEMHNQWGGIVPSLAKRNHIERIDGIIAKALKRAQLSFSDIDAFAVTYGPGLAMGLEVGVTKAKELSNLHNKPLIAVNHLAGHIYSVFVQNKMGNPVRPIEYPYLGLIVSGGNTILLILKSDLEFEILGETLDDASGEALDKAARLMGLGYPGGMAIERLAEEVKNEDKYKFPRPLWKEKKIVFSFSGLKTAFLYFYRKLSPEEQINSIAHLSSSYQEAVFDCIIQKTGFAIQQTGITKLVVGGGVIANKHLRNKLRRLMKSHNGTVYFPPFKYLTGDNAGMIGVVAGLKAQKKEFVANIESLERVPRLGL
ncbi:MAG: tRNA (adenosine(37)-N6)-threonylcarbamoyltransferase complex transferase subunit TsaD [Candidatus Roizmanbacteria bacterium]